MEMDFHAERYIKRPDIRVLHTERTASTNTDALRLAREGEEEGLLLIAREQTGGRGRLGRRFHSPGGTGLYMSMLLRPRCTAEETLLLTPMAAVAVAEALETVCGVSAGIKWVNDIVWNGKKICGILTEALYGTGNGPDAVVVGIGLNLAAPPTGFPEEIASIAGAVYEGECPDGTVAPRLTAEIWERFFAYYRGEAERAFQLGYRRRQILTGRRIFVLRDGETVPATALGVDDRCGLTVRYEDQRVETLTCGEVSVRPA